MNMRFLKLFVVVDDRDILYTMYIFHTCCLDYKPSRKLQISFP